MNPIQLYNDPALDDLVDMNDRPQRGGSGYKSNGDMSYRSVSDGYDAVHGRTSHIGAEGARSSLISYRAVGPDADPSLHRPFSQRAKHRPFAEEAFRDDEVLDDLVPQPQPQPQLSSRADEPNLMNNAQLRTSQEAPKPQTRVAGNRDQRAKQEGNAASTSQHRSRSVQHQPTQPTAHSSVTLQRSSTYKNGSSQAEAAPSEWAVDRSPLQKLEVKLTDISKEEKRARVQEAEMRLMRDQKLGKIQDRSRHETPQSSSTQPIRVVSQRPNDPVSARSATNRNSQSARGTRHYSQSQPPPVGQDPKTSGHRRSSSQQSPHISQSGPTLAQREMPLSSHLVTPARTVSLNEGQAEVPARAPSGRTSNARSMANSIPLQHASSAPSQHSRSRRTRDDDRPITERERNASHQAALDQLTGSKPPQIKSSQSQKHGKPAVHHVEKVRTIPPSDSPVPVDLSSISGGDSGLNSASQRTRRQAEPQIPPKSTRLDAGLEVQQPKAMHSVDSPPASLVDTSKHRQRKSSVSFKEPFDRRRPIDEWKHAKTAVLNADDFLSEKAEAPEMDTPWWEKSPSQKRRESQSKTASEAPVPVQSIDDRTAQFSPPLYLKCGPLLRYAGLRRLGDEAEPDAPQREFWRGSIMIVTQDSRCSYNEVPTLRLFSQPKRLLPPPPAVIQGDHLAPEYIDPIAGLTKLSRTGKARYVRPVDHLDQEKDISQLEDDTGLYESSPSPSDENEHNAATYDLTNGRLTDQNGEQLDRYREVKGVRLYADPDRDVTFWRFNIEVELGFNQQHIAYRINKGAITGFWVPPRGKSMNIMFHSCNGFSMSVDANKFSGPDPLWRDVLNNHQTRPFHVMIGGGDQIYNDRVMTQTQLFAEWTQIKNPHHKHQAPFTNEMKEELETFYLERYCLWFSQGLFAMANASIPMVNVWDDHDIIDGFGSYPDHFMRSPVFSGLGSIAFKYYMLFQHQSLEIMTEKEEPSWLLGHSPGPYIRSKSRSLYLELGQSVAFLGIDCRTERTKEDVLSIDTLELILDRCRKEMVEGRTKHLIVLLGVPIAYPRLVWLENVLTSRAIEPLKAMGRAGLIKSGFLNKFDGGVEILDDLDDHWTASHHKHERNILIQELQDLAAEKSVRITILGGDVHLAAIGQFYSNPKLRVPKDRDHRYMPNIISSAIVNTPPPDIMADVLNKRNKIHHLDKYTHENMIPMFTHDVDNKKRNNVHLLPRRNWCSIREYLPGETPPSTPSLESDATEDVESLSAEHQDWDLDQQPPKRRPSLTKIDFNPRNLIRRLSSRNAPPSSFRAGPDSNRPQQVRAASFDDARMANGQPPTDVSRTRAASADDLAEVPALRPNFFRRPTNLSEKAARKGNVPALDADGNEFDVNDHINLEGGLDITINCEVDQKDPSGITTPYRILIPALWYDGTSDIEKLDDTQKIGRRETVLRKFGLGAKGPSRAADNQGAGNWGKDSESESQAGSDHGQQPRRSFSLFGSLRKKKQSPLATNAEPYQIQHNKEDSDGVSFTESEDELSITKNSQPLSTSQDHPSTHRAGARQDTEVNPQHDFVAQHNRHVPDVAAVGSFYAPPQPSSKPQPQLQSKSQPSPQAQIANQTLHRDVSTTSRRSSRPASYTIGSDNLTGKSPSYQKPQPYDADASYIAQQYRSEPRNDSQTHQRHLSKPERVLGIASTVDNYQDPPQTQLRGNGILGKNIPTSFPDSGFSGRPTTSSGNSNRLSQGYSGVEAYREPRSKRRWSLSIRDKARNLIENVEGRRRDDMYVDDDEEDYWEGPREEQARHQAGRHNDRDHQRSY